MKVLRSHLPLIVAAGMMVLMAACSDSPTGPKPQSLALHFDSLAALAWGKNDGLAAYVYENAAVPLDFGAKPITGAVTLNGTSATYEIIGYEHVFYDSTGGLDSTFTFIGWPAASPKNAVMVTVYEPADLYEAIAVSATQGELLENNPGNFSASPAGNAGAVCASGLDLYSVGYYVAYSTCAFNRITMSFDVPLGSYPSGSGSAELSFQSNTFPSVRLQDRD